VVQWPRRCEAYARLEWEASSPSERMGAGCRGGWSGRVRLGQEPPPRRPAAGKQMDRVEFRPPEHPPDGYEAHLCRWGVFPATAMLLRRIGNVLGMDQTTVPRPRRDPERATPTGMRPSRAACTIPNPRGAAVSSIDFHLSTGPAPQEW